MADINPTQQPGSSTSGNVPIPGGEVPTTPTPLTSTQPEPPSMEPSRGPSSGDLPNLGLHPQETVLIPGADTDNVETPDEDGDG